MTVHHGMGLRQAIGIARHIGIIIREDGGELIFIYPGLPSVRVNRRKHDAPRKLTALVFRVMAAARPGYLSGERQAA